MQPAGKRRAVLTDAHLLARARRGEGIAFSALVQRHYGRAVRLAWVMVGNVEAAEGVAQEAFAHLGSVLSWLPDGDALPPWLFRLVVHYGRRDARRRRDAMRWRPHRPALLPLHDTALWPRLVLHPNAEPDRAGEPSGLRRLLAPLAPLDSAALILREVESLDLSAVAHALRWPRLWVARRLDRARQRVRAALYTPAPARRRFLPEHG